jgi:hypothetical protein
VAGGGICPHCEGDKVSKEIEKIQHDTESQITSLFKDILSKFAAA